MSAPRPQWRCRARYATQPRTAAADATLEAAKRWHDAVWLAAMAVDAEVTSEQ